MTTLQPQEVIQQRYQLEQRLGQNAGRETWLAKDLERSQELVVVKFLAFGGQVQWDDLKLFERESQILKQLDHPRIPKYRDYFAIDEQNLWFGLVQEYIAGVSLKDCVSNGQKFSETQVQKIAIAILDILIYLHQLNPSVLHRDIKPSNLILAGDIGSDWQVYLVDFGAAQDRTSAEGKSFTVVGTYGYAPMEQYGGRAVAASDLYALGATMIYLLTGVNPADLPQDEDCRIMFSDRTSASLHFVKWIQNLIEPNVKKRYATAKIALEKLYQKEPIPQPTPPPIALRNYPTRRSHRIYPPENTNIQLEEIAGELKITLPSRPLPVIISLLVVAFGTLMFGNLIITIIAIVILGSLNLLFQAIGIIILILILRLILNSLTKTCLEINDLGIVLSRYIFGKCYWSKKSQSPSESFYAEPEWVMMQKHLNNNFLGWLIWLSSEKSDDNSIKSNVKIFIGEDHYLLSPRNLRPTEVNWLIDVINNFR